MYNEHMTAQALNFRRNHSPVKQMLAALLIITFGITVASGLALATSSVYKSYNDYVNRPPFLTYTSKLGSLSFVYPSSVVLEKRSYSNHIESVTLRRSYNANDVTDSGLQKYSGLIFVSVWNMKCEYKGCPTMEEQMKRDAEIFRKVYFYGDPERPDELRQDQKYNTVNLVHDTRKIDGHTSEYYSAEKIGIGYSTGDYAKHVYILVPVGDFLYEIDGKVETSQYDEAVHDTTYLDKLIDSIKIGNHS